MSNVKLLCKRFVLGILWLVAANCSAQIIFDKGAPYQWQAKSVHPAARSLELPALDQSQFKHLITDPVSLDGPFEWGVPRNINLDVMAQASRSIMPDGRVKRIMKVVSPGAAMMSLHFSQFDLAHGTQVYLYNTRKTKYIGPLTERNELPSGTMTTAVLPGEGIVIEIQQPALSAKSADVLVLENLVHGVVDIFGFGEQTGSKDYSPGFDSQPCNVNVACPVASPWQDQKRAVAMFLNNAGWGCNGVMLNNTAEDGTPYFQVANHCYTTQTPTWVFYWNYESPTCVGDTGQTLQTQVGGAHVASDFYKDFALLELYNQPPPSYNVYYAGWDATGAQPSTQTVIHHPYYDVKKIAFDYDPAGTYTNSYGTNLWSCTWELGIVEFFSSGGPLFDQNKRVVGLMTEGANACFNVQNEVTGCAKFHDMWTGATPAERFQDHLDPLNTGVLVLDGFDPNATGGQVKLNARVMLQGAFDPVTGMMTDALRVSGFVPNQEPYTALGYSFSDGGGQTTSSSFLSLTGPRAIVDWIVVELRDKNDVTLVIASTAGLVRRDGLIVDETGQQPSFTVAPDDYYVAIRHRNHLPNLSANTHVLSSTSPVVDFTSPGVPLHTSSASIINSGVRLMLGGDATGDMQLSYTGSANDRDQILLNVGGVNPASVNSGYYSEDCNLDGEVKYAGPDNDRDLILLNIGGNSVNSIIAGGLP